MDCIALWCWNKDIDALTVQNDRMFRVMNKKIQKSQWLRIRAQSL